MLPILLIVGFLCLSVSPVSPDLLLSFFLGSILIIVGMGLFTLGAETSMTPIGNRIGTALTKSRNLPLILLVSLVLGFSITIAEPDLQVLAETVPHINNTVLLVTVGLGVGFFLAVCMHSAPVAAAAVLRRCFCAGRAGRFGLFERGVRFRRRNHRPYDRALYSGAGRGRFQHPKRPEGRADSFGLVALCSIGPILAVLVLGFFYSSPETAAEVSVLSYGSTTEIGRAYLTAFPFI